MILRSNLQKLREFGGRSARVLDAGGWYRPFNLATHVIDLNPYEARRVDDALDPDDDCRYLDRAGNSAASPGAANRDTVTRGSPKHFALTPGLNRERLRERTVAGVHRLDTSRSALT